MVRRVESEAAAAACSMADIYLAIIACRLTGAGARRVAPERGAAGEVERCRAAPAPPPRRRYARRTA